MKNNQQQQQQTTNHTVLTACCLVEYQQGKPCSRCGLMTCKVENPTILNLTQHQTTQEQAIAGVFEPTLKDKEKIKNLLTFSTAPTFLQALETATALADIAKEYNPTHALIDVAPWFTGILTSVLSDIGIRPVFLFSRQQKKPSFIGFM